jgi:NADPH:quinone reductase-like Zn-dependent oxidoreductase
MSEFMRAVGMITKISALICFLLYNNMADFLDVHATEGDIPATALYINEKIPKPHATGSKAVVRINAFGLNRMDIGQRQGRYPLAPHIPKTLGVEYSGIIEELGPENGDEVEDFKVGDEVFGLAYGGEYKFHLHKA